MHKPEQGAGGRFSPVPTIIFPNWREMLNQASLSGAARGGYTLAISNYLEYCRLNGVSVTLESARAYMRDAERRKLARNPGAES
jgi:hypothetical protein